MIYNKALQLTSQYAVSLRYTLYCPSTEFNRQCVINIKEYMLLSSTQNNVAIKYHHHELSMVSHWWFLKSRVVKTLLSLFLIHRSYSIINIKHRRNNLNLQSVKTVLNSIQWFNSARLSVSTNKSINADCQKSAFFLPAKCAAGYFKRYV